MKFRGLVLLASSVLAVAAIAACGGGSVSAPTGGPTVTPVIASPIATTPVPIPSSSPYAATQSTVVTAPTVPPSGQPLPSPVPVAMPAAGGVTPTLYLPAAISGGNVQITATLQNALPTGLPALSVKRASGRAAAAFRRITQGSGANGITFLGLYWAAPITLVSLPSFTFTLPAADIFSNVDYYIAIYDPSRPSLAWEEGWEGPATVSGTTLSFSGGSSSYTFAGSLTYWLAVIAIPKTAVQPTPAPSTAPTTVPTQAPPPVAQAASQANVFVGSVGVNTHFTYPAYTSILSSVTSLLAASNIRHIRDGLVNEPVTAPYYSTLSQLSAQGIGSDLIASVGETASQVQSAMTVSGVEAVEGPNEYDLTATASPSPNPNWAAQVSAYQAALYGYVKQTSALPVIAPSFTTETAYGSVGNLSAVATYGNARGYFAGRNPGTSGFGAADAFGVYGSIPWQLAMVAQDTGTDPIWVTETGYNDSSGDYVVPPAVKARYLMRTLLEFWNAGVTRSYIYELVDEPGVPGPSEGLISSTGTPKLAYTAVTNFLAQLTDPGASFTSTPLSVGISAATTVHHTLLEKRDGSYRLLLWVEAPSWDPVGLTALTVAPQSVVLSFAAAPSSISAVQFTDSGTTAAQTLSVSGSVVTLSVTDDVTIVTIHP